MLQKKRGQNKSAKWPFRCSTFGLNHFGIFKTSIFEEIQNVQTKIRKINFWFIKDVAEKKRPKQKCKMAIKMQHNGIISFLNHQVLSSLLPCIANKTAKGQLISKYTFGVIVWTKYQRKDLTNFWPRIWKVDRS